MDVGILWNDHCAWVGGVILANRHDIEALRGSDRRFVSRRDDDILLTCQKRRKKALVRPVVPNCWDDTVIRVRSLRVRNVNGRELNVGDVRQADRDLRIAVRSRLSGLVSRRARRQDQRSTCADDCGTNDCGKLQEILLHCVIS